MIQRVLPHTMRCTATFALVALSTALLAATSCAQAILPVRQLNGHMPPVIADSRAVGPVDEGEQVHLALTLHLRNESQFDTLLKRLYNPADPAYGHFLTPQQFAATFGPTPADYEAVISYAQEHGMTVTGTHSNRLVVDVAGPARQVESAFGVRLLSYQVPC